MDYKYTWLLMRTFHGIANQYQVDLKPIIEKVRLGEAKIMQEGKQEHLTWVTYSGNVSTEECWTPLGYASCHKWCVVPHLEVQ